MNSNNLNNNLNNSQTNTSHKITNYPNNLDNKLLSDSLKNSSSFNFNIKPLQLITKQLHNPEISAMKKTKFKDFTLLDSSNPTPNSRQFHKNVLEKSGRFQKLQKILEVENHYKFWFEVNPKVLDSIENLIYLDYEGDNRENNGEDNGEDNNNYENGVKFENVFILFKVAVSHLRIFVSFFLNFFF